MSVLNFTRKRTILNGITKLDVTHEAELEYNGGIREYEDLFDYIKIRIQGTVIA